MTKRKPESDQTTAEVEATPRRARPVRRPGGKKYYIQFLPEGVNSEPEFKIELPAHVDPERFIEKQEDFEAGRYRIALRDDGKFTRESWVYRKDDELAAVNTNSNADDADDVDDAFDKDLLVSELAEAAALPEDFDRRVAEIAARAAIVAVEAKERARLTQPAPTQPDPFAFIERSMEIEEKIRARAVRNNPAREEAKDSSEQFIDMLDRFTTIAERIAPIREADKEGSNGWLNGIASIVREVGTHGKPLLSLLPALMGQVQGAGANGTAAVGAQVTPNAGHTPEQLMSDTLRIIVEDLKRNKRVGRAADAIDDLFAKFPDVKAQLEPFFNAPVADLLLQLSQACGEDLSTYSHAVSWIEELQQEIGGVEEGEEEAEINKSSEPGVSPDTSVG